MRGGGEAGVGGSPSPHCFPQHSAAPTITISGGGASSDATATATIGTITYTGYKTYAVKLVPLGTNTVEVPKLKDLRAIALQA